MMKRSTKDRAKGTVHEVKGAIKAGAGRLTGNRALQAKGVAEKTVGKIQKKIGQVEEAIEKSLMLTSLHTVEWQRLFDRAQGIAQSWGRALNLNLSEISTTQMFIGIAVALTVAAALVFGLRWAKAERKNYAIVSAAPNILVR